MACRAIHTFAARQTPFWPRILARLYNDQVPCDHLHTSAGPHALRPPTSLHGRRIQRAGGNKIVLHVKSPVARQRHGKPGLFRDSRVSATVSIELKWTETMTMRVDDQDFRNMESEKARIADLMAILPDGLDTVLDIGARDGFISKLLASRCSSVSTTDRV